MCGIFGAIINNTNSANLVRARSTFLRCSERGRDSWGLVRNFAGLPFEKQSGLGECDADISDSRHICIGNWRGEPTTEYVLEKTEEHRQPFISPSEEWAIVHNGTIANDKALYDSLGFVPPRSMSM